MSSLFGPLTMTQTLDQVRTRALRVLRDEDSAQDFAIEIWRDLTANKPIRHFGGYVRLRLRKAIHRQFNGTTKRHMVLAADLGYDEEDSGDQLEMLANEIAYANPFRPDYELLPPTMKGLADLLSAGYSAPDIARLRNVYPRLIYDTIYRYRRKISPLGW